jgi:hypothetical protein
MATACHLSELALCPNRHRCMTGIEVERVWRELARVLG